MTGWTKHGYTDAYRDYEGDTLNVIVGHTGNVLFDVIGGGCQVSGKDLTTLIDLLVAARDKAASDGMEERARLLAEKIRYGYGYYATDAHIAAVLWGERDPVLVDRVRTLIATARVEVTWKDES